MSFGISVGASAAPEEKPPTITIYVDPIHGINELGDGSAINPYKTLRYAIANAPAGSTIGVYADAATTLFSENILTIPPDITVSTIPPI